MTSKRIIVEPWLIDHPQYRKPMIEQTSALEVAQRQLDAGKRGAGFFMDGGTGKTLAAYNVFLHMRRQGFVDHMNVECPNHAKGVWREQLLNCGPVAKGLKIRVWPEEPDDCDIFVFNYEMTQHASVDVPTSRVERFRTLSVFDESHRGKDWKRATARTMVDMGKKSPFSLCLTGTPFGENVMDLWPQLRVIGAISGTGPLEFRSKYGIMGGFQGTKVVGVKNEDELDALLNSCSYRATLSSRTEHRYGEIFCEMLPKQKAMYIQMYRERFVPLLDADDSTVTADMIVTVLLKLQQIASGYMIDDDRVTHELVPIKKNPRIGAVLDALRDKEGKVLIFTQSRYSTDALEAALSPKGVAIRGGMSEAEIDAAKHAFNTNPKIRYFIAPTTMAKESHTLLGDQTKKSDACFSTVFYETTYSRIGRTQAEWRNSRKGQRYPVWYGDVRQTHDLGRGVLDINLHTIDALRHKQTLVDRFRTARTDAR